MMKETDKISHWYQEPYVWLVILFPASAVIAGIITVYLAISSQDGLVVDDYYKRGLEINKTLARDRRSESLALKATIDTSYQPGMSQIRLEGNPGFVPPETIQISYLHKTRGGFDQVIIVNKDPHGNYTFKRPGLTMGYWHIMIEADDWRILEELKAN